MRFKSFYGLGSLRNLLCHQCIIGKKRLDEMNNLPDEIKFLPIVIKYSSKKKQILLTFKNE